ncbi:MAG: hypothetical protein J0I79_34670 [Mesorhizobium sp.]|uniref:hypothetical protein n=1 Tax=Mesorhizobium sp. TaxID=1871066 RepID=UPI001AC443F7|nr:hypothetical protein [Mesorhizobium sp.]MBN9223099.1 hypothetical protein [Mesorhizobium sp.]
MAQLHMRGVELVHELLSAADSIDNMKQQDVVDLLRETAQVLGDLLKRDNPEKVISKAERPRA